jgi:cell division protein FtsQ
MKKYRKSYRIKKKKSIFQNRSFWLPLLVLIVFGGFLYLVFFADFFQIKEIKIFGQEKVSNEELKNLLEGEIEQKLFLFPTKSIFLVDLNKIKEMILKKFPQIVKVDLKRKLPDKLFLEIKERRPWAALIIGENFYYCDENGILFEEILEIPPKFLIIKNLLSQPEIKLGEKVIEKDFIEKIEEIKKKLVENLKIEIEEIIIPTKGRLNVKTSEGWEIYFDPNADLNWQMIELNLVLEKEIPLENRGNLEYIDLRFSKIYYKYR